MVRHLLLRLLLLLHTFHDALFAEGAYHRVFVAAEGLLQDLQLLALHLRLLVPDVLELLDRQDELALVVLVLHLQVNAEVLAFAGG